MANVNYLVRSRKKSGNATVWARIKNGTTLDFMISTQVEMPINLWKLWENSSLDFNKKINRDCSSEEITLSNSITGRLKAIHTKLTDELPKYVVFTQDIARKVISDYLESITIKGAESIIPTDIVGYLGYKIPLMKSGEMLHGGSRYDDNTIKVWNSFLKVLTGFTKYHKKTVYIVDIDKNVYDSFMNYLAKCDYLPKTRNKYIICFKALIGFADDDGVILNRDAQKHFSKLKVNNSDKATRIYLNETEIQAFYDMQLDAGSMYDKVRDIFLCGCYTAQRVSDYGRLTGDNFAVTAKGNKVVKITQTKTGNEVVVPYLNDNLRAIADKYNGEIPQVSDVIVNRYIKQIGAKLSESVPSLAKMEKTILTQKEKVNEKAGKMIFKRDKYGNVVRPRYDMICTHTARRSAITNMYLTGLFDTFQLMTISGHQSELAFLGYLCMSSEEMADKIAELLKKRKAGVEHIF